ncbi:MAG: signal peptidase I [Armatimonadota bacterium]
MNTSLTEKIANLPIEYIIAISITLLIARLILGRYKSRRAKSVTELVESLLVAVVLVFLVIRPFVVQAFYIPSESMEPTLLEKDRLLVNKFIYRFAEPRHGDVIVFKSPPTANEARDADGKVIMMAQDIDRASALFNWNEVAGKVIAAVGDKGEVRIRPTTANRGEFSSVHHLCIMGKSDMLGRILPIEKQSSTEGGSDLVVKFLGINDKASAEELVGKEVRIGVKDYIKRVIGVPGDTLEVRAIGPGQYGSEEFALYRNGEPLDETYIKETPDYAMPKITVPEGKLFVMGDNRRNSNDSHRWGQLDRQRVVGKAMTKFWPLGRMGLVR